MTVLVTGGGGFLGGAIIDMLLARRVEVRSFARGAYPDLVSKGVDVRRGDLADQRAVASAIEGCEAVFHVAAKAGVYGPAAEFHSANVTGTENVLAGCATHGVSRLVFTSTPSVVHGGGDVSGVDETAPYATSWSSPYPESKARAEQMVLAANGSELATVAIRPHLVWGPGDRQLVPTLVERARSGRARLIGSGDNLVDSTFIDNAAEAHLLAFDRLAPESAVAGRAYFIAQDEPMPMRDLISAMLGAAGVEANLAVVPVGVAKAAGSVVDAVYRGLRIRGEPPVSRFLVEQLATDHWYDLTAARRDLGYGPRVSFAAGLERLTGWYRDHPPGWEPAAD